MEKELVYKFRDCENEFHRRMLLKNEICFASPESLNDPFDCHIDYNFLSLTDAEREEYINNQIQYEEEEAIKSGKYIDKKVLRTIIEETLNDKVELLKLQEKHKEENFTALNRILGVFCCCQSTIKEEGWQNIILWSHYANNHKGFCVGIDKDLLCSKFTNGPLDVKPVYPKLKPFVAIEKNRKKIMENFKIEISSKFKSWEYENELRFVKINTNNFNGSNQEDRRVILPQGFIVEVTMGICIDDWHKKAIMTICKSKGIKLYQAVKKPFEFSITREEIDLN